MEHLILLLSYSSPQGATVFPYCGQRWIPRQGWYHELDIRNLHSSNETCRSMWRGKSLPRSSMYSTYICMSFKSCLRTTAETPTRCGLQILGRLFNEIISSDARRGWGIVESYNTTTNIISGHWWKRISYVQYIATWAEICRVCRYSMSIMALIPSISMALSLGGRTRGV